METEYQRGYREGAEKMREGAAIKAESACWLWDVDWLAKATKGNVSEESCRIVAEKIRALPIVPPQPAAKDDEREMREAFEAHMTDQGAWPHIANKNKLGHYTSTKANDDWQLWKAAWKEKSK